MPRSWKPEWERERDNLVKCSPKAHYLIHHLMWKAFSSDKSMAYAFWMMSTRKDKQISAIVFERVRLECSVLNSNRMTGQHRSADSCAKQSKSMSGKNHPMYGKTGEQHQKFGKKHTPETRLKQSVSLVGIPKSEEHKAKISVAKIGENNHCFGRTGEKHPMYGKKHTKVTCLICCKTVPINHYYQKHRCQM